MGSNEKITSSLPICLYQLPIPYPQRVAWAKPSKLEPRFTRFLDLMRRIYVSAPFLEALRESLAHLRFLRGLHSKKNELIAITEVPVGEVSSAVLQNKTLSKL